MSEGIPTPQETPSLQVVFSGGWCTNRQSLRERQNIHHPQESCTGDVQNEFSGGGARIVGFYLTSTLLTSTLVLGPRGFPFAGFKLEWSLVATSLEGFSVTVPNKKDSKGLF